MGAFGIALAAVVLGLIAYRNWGPTNISITVISYGPKAWRWEVDLQDGEDLVFHWRGNDLDPEYIVGSMTHRREWIYSPRLQMTPFDCKSGGDAPLPASNTCLARSP